MKKGRHRRFEEARALKRSHEVDLEGLFEDISDAPDGEHKPEHDAWADLAEEWDSKPPEASDGTDTGADTAEDAADSDTEDSAQADVADGDSGDSGDDDAAEDDAVEDAAS